MGTSPADEAGTAEPRSGRVPPGAVEELLKTGRRLLEEPNLRARLDEIMAEMRSGITTESGVSAEELRAFLREHGL